ncbi:MAG: helix-turn-helix domain-containing protein [Candidatus Dormibacteraceae bacterium]
MTQSMTDQVVQRPSQPMRAIATRDYVGFNETSKNERQWIEVPSANLTLILNYTNPFGGFPTCFVAGLTDSFRLVQTRPGTCCMDVKLSPLGAFRLFGVPMHELSRGITDLRFLIPPPSLDRVRDVRGWHARFTALDALLSGLAANGRLPARQLSWAWERLVASRGRVSIRSIADEVGWSGKHLIAMFKEQIGLRPKTISRILRFQSAVQRLERSRSVDWADVAVASGYCDQSHLIREFRKLTGSSPAEYLRRPGSIPSRLVIGEFRPRHSTQPQLI